MNGICPVCKKPLIIGVDYRVEEIAKNPAGFKAENAKPFHSLLPLHELISLRFSTSLSSKKSWESYNSLIEIFGNEFNILLNISEKEMSSKGVDEKLIDLIIKNREGKIKVKPGFDGEYGVALLGEQQAKLI